MEIRSLHAFLIVAEELNFRKAADRLNITQPPLTRTIAQLEDSLGVKLFDRNTRSVTLTAEGFHLFSEAQRILADLSQLEKSIKKLRQRQLPPIQIGFAGTSLHSSMPKLISSYEELVPQSKIELHEIKRPLAKKHLTDKSMDLIFTDQDLKEPNLERKIVEKEELGFLIHPSNPLTRKKSLRLSDLKDQTLIFHSKKEKLGFQLHFLKLLQEKNISTKVYYKKPQEHCPHLVLLNRGILLSTRRSAPQQGGVVFLPIEDYKSQLRTFALWRSDNSSLGLKDFVNFLTSKLKTPQSKVGGHF